MPWCFFCLLLPFSEFLLYSLLLPVLCAETFVVPNQRFLISPSDKNVNMFFFGASFRHFSSCSDPALKALKRAALAPAFIRLLFRIFKSCKQNVQTASDEKHENTSFLSQHLSAEANDLYGGRWGGGKRGRNEKRAGHSTDKAQKKGGKKSITGEFPEKNELHLSHRWHAMSETEREMEGDGRSEGEMLTDTGRYLSGEVEGGGEGREAALKRGDNTAREDEKDEGSVSERGIHHERSVCSSLSFSLSSSHHPLGPGRPGSPSLIAPPRPPPFF